MVAVASGFDLLVQVADRQRRRDPVRLRGKRAHTLDPVDQALGLQLAQRAVDRHPADAELRDQF